MSSTVVRHDAKFSPAVLDVLRRVLADVDGPVFDPFAGLGLSLADLGRWDVSGCELEPEWAGVSPLVVQGDALDRAVYPADVGCVMTSPCYGNRFADQYLGPVCEVCDGLRLVDDGVSAEAVLCGSCGGSGRDGSGRYGYAISLGRPVSVGSAAGLQWGPKYRAFHRGWLELIADLLPMGPRRLVLNVSDHNRRRERQYVSHWWVEAAGRAGFRLVEAHAVVTPRFGHGQNQESKAEAENVFVFDLAGRRLEKELW